MRTTRGPQTSCCRQSCSHQRRGRPQRGTAPRPRGSRFPGAAGCALAGCCSRLAVLLYWGKGACPAGSGVPVPHHAGGAAETRATADQRRSAERCVPAAAWVHPRSSWSAGLNSCLLPLFALQGKLLGFGNTLLPLARLSQAVSTTFGSEKRSSSLPNNKVGDGAHEWQAIQPLHLWLATRHLMAGHTCCAARSSAHAACMRCRARMATSSRPETAGRAAKRCAGKGAAEGGASALRQAAFCV